VQTGSAEWKRIVQDGVRAWGIRLSPEQLELFAAHALELLEWNRKVNLTAVTDPEEMAEKHYVDSCAPVPFLSTGASVLDIGSGAGFPGIPMAVLRLDCRVRMMESSRKKVNFLRQAVRLLGLQNAEALEMRAENAAKMEGHRNAYDVVLSRALGSLDGFLQLAEPLLAPGGCCIAMKGRDPGSGPEGPARVKDGEGTRAPIGGVRWKAAVHRYRLPREGSRRALVVCRRESRDK
jgi:16S rRNA (guanine527-N7)-methyltransferase